MANASTIWLRPSPSLAVDEQQQCGRATFEARMLTDARVCVTVTGDVDATNRQDLGRFVERHTRVSKQLVLDLSRVDFFGSQGFTALHYIGVQCSRRDVDWMIVGHRNARRIIRICDPEGELPVVADLEAARSRLDHLVRCHTMTSWVG